MKFDCIQLRNYNFNQDVYENPCKKNKIDEIQWNAMKNYDFNQDLYRNSC